MAALKFLDTLLLLARGMILAMVAGCADGDRPELLRVSGTITYRGKPLAGARISFIPADTSSRPAMAVTDQKGRYQLTTYDSFDGAVAGKHAVAIALRAPYDGPKPAHAGKRFGRRVRRSRQAADSGKILLSRDLRVDGRCGRQGNECGRLRFEGLIRALLAGSLLVDRFEFRAELLPLAPRNGLVFVLAIALSAERDPGK